MGKGTIASGGADGLYSVTLDYGQAARDARVADINADLARLVTTIAALQAALDAAQAIEDAQRIVVDAAIETYIAVSKAGVKAAIEPALDAYTEAATALAKLKGDTARVRIPLDLMKARQVQLTKDLARWTALVMTETVPAWCADLTEDATGLVATVEIPGENKLVLIAPAAPAPVAADGLLTAREVQTPAQVFWNAAVLPGWQKYKPTYRRGTITAIDHTADTADVTLDADLSSAQALNINPAATLAAVPVQYMTCHSAAFEAGDKCVVKFTNQDWAQPKVVGFVDHPKSCGGNLHCLPWSAAAPTGYPAAAPSSYWPRVLTSAAPVALMPFQPPHSSLGYHPGATSWCNPDITLNNLPVVLTWRGPDYRYSPCTDWAVINDGNWSLGHLQQLGQGMDPFVDSYIVWVNGKRIGTPVTKIIAAALYKPEPVDRPQRIILRLFTDYYFPSIGADRMTAFYDVECAGADAEARVLTLARLVAGDELAITATYPGPVYSAPGWRKLVQRPHFNQSGTAIAGICSWNTFYKPFTLAASDPAAPVLMAVAEVTSSADHAQASVWSWVGEPTWTGTTTDTVTTSETEIKQTFYAADFVGDVPVTLYTEATVTRTTSSSGTYAATFGPPEGSGPEAVYETYADTTSSMTISNRTIRLVHTLHGELKSKTYTGSIGAQTTVLHQDNGFFCGDLSKNMICFGLAETDITYSQDSINAVDTKTVTRYNPRYLLEFWYLSPTSAALVKSAHTVTGGYHFTGSTDPYVYAVTPPSSGGYWRSPLTIYSYTSTAVRNQTAPANWEWPFQHAAADPLGRVAYFGAGQYQQGANVLLRAADDTLLTVPAYAPGGYPNTLMSPVIF